MPTAPKLFAAIAFALLAFVAAEALKPYLPEGTPFGFLSEICAAFGALTGWLMMGKMAGRGYSTAISSGIGTSVVMVFFSLLAFSGREMILRSLDHRYKGPQQAVEAVFGLMIDYGKLLANPSDLAILVGGAAVAGLFVEWTSRRWL
ncbi:MAG: TrgA family protein [Rhodobacteraceae bacterium]|nr:TrgA family protein [Paracoccaceae bacterium]